MFIRNKGWFIIGAICAADFLVVWSLVSTMIDADKDVSIMRAFMSGCVVTGFLYVTLGISFRIIDSIYQVDKINKAYANVRHVYQSNLRRAEESERRVEELELPLHEALEYLKDPHRVKTTRDKSFAIASRIEQAMRKAEGLTWNVQEPEYEAPKRIEPPAIPMPQRNHMQRQLEALKNNPTFFENKYPLKRKPA